MAPQKTTMVLKPQQQQPQTQSNGHQSGDQLSNQANGKPRKRKGRQTSNSSQISQQNSLEIEQVEKPAPKQQQQPQQQQQQQVTEKTAGKIGGQNDKVNTQSKENLVNNKQTVATTVVPNERITLKKQQENKVPNLVKESESKQRAMPAMVTPTQLIGKQLSHEDADEIDAGIELDGSSYSGSSVKDISEDQLKSASVSPVMAQSNTVSETSTKQVVEVSPLNQLTGSLCSPTVTSARKINTTKQQLAANQQVIDADEQLLQEKLQRKQPVQNGTAEPNVLDDGDQKKISPIQDDKSTRVRRKFSTQTSQEAHDGSLCKVCEQHVYQMERMLAEKSIYHKRCFRCYQCKIQLRIDNYSSHEGQVYCKAHHRQLLQPQVKLDNEDDVDIVAKSTEKTVDDYLLHRGRLSELSFSFLHQKTESEDTKRLPTPKRRKDANELNSIINNSKQIFSNTHKTYSPITSTYSGIQKRQMIICENEPAELPKDVVRCDTKVDDGIDQMNLNLSNILEKFERGTAGNGEESQPSSAGVVIDKPSFNIKKTLMAFELNKDEPVEAKQITERPVVKKLTNLDGFLNRQNSQENEQALPAKPLSVRRSESLMMRLKKYESRIAGEKVEDDDESDGEESSTTKENGVIKEKANNVDTKRTIVPKKINLSSLKNQWETGDISNRRDNDDEDAAANESNCNGNSPTVEKNEELVRIRQQLSARKRSSEAGSIRNIYENAVKEAQLQQKQQASSRRDSSDFSALNGLSTSEIQQQLLQNGSNNCQNNTSTPNTPNKDHFQLNLSNKANKLKEKFELGLITNSSRDDSDLSDGDETPALTKLEQIRQEKMEDLSIFTEGEIKAREARSLFQQIDRRISAASGNPKPAAVVNSRSLASIGTSMRAKLTNHMNANGTNHEQPHKQESLEQQPIRLINNVRT